MTVEILTHQIGLLNIIQNPETDEQLNYAVRQLSLIDHEMAHNFKRETMKNFSKLVQGAKEHKLNALKSIS